MRRFFLAFGILLLLFVAPVGIQWALHMQAEPTAWWTMRRDSSEQAPPANQPGAVIQVYAARAARWRGNLGVHSWVTYKRSDAAYYERLEVIGYYGAYGGNTVRQRRGNPDSYWFGNRPQLLRQITGGAHVDQMIDRLEAAADAYPYNTQYKVWPGPNSNTFVAWLAKAVPELRLELPPLAIGKDYLPDNAFAARTPSHRGVQVSLGGYAGLLIGLEEGIEINLLAATVGVDVWPPAFKLPGLGRLGVDDLKEFHFP